MLLVMTHKKTKEAPNKYKPFHLWAGEETNESPERLRMNLSGETYITSGTEILQDCRRGLQTSKTIQVCDPPPIHLTKTAICDTWQMWNNFDIKAMHIIL